MSKNILVIPKGALLYTYEGINKRLAVTTENIYAVPITLNLANMSNIDGQFIMGLSVSKFPFQTNGRFYITCTIYGDPDDADVFHVIIKYSKKQRGYEFVIDPNYI